MSQESLILCHFGLTEDTLRHPDSLHTVEEITKIFNDTGFDINHITVIGPKEVLSLLQTKNTLHTITFTAQIKR